MTKARRPQNYPKEETENQKDTIQKLKSQLRRLQKNIKILKAENESLKSAWIKTEEFLAEIMEGRSLEEILENKRLPKKVTRKNTMKKIDRREEVREKYKNWNKERE